MAIQPKILPMRRRLLSIICTLLLWSVVFTGAAEAGDGTAGASSAGSTSLIVVVPERISNITVGRAAQVQFTSSLPADEIEELWLSPAVATRQFDARKSVHSKELIKVVLFIPRPE